jgi:competence protein ComEC
MRAWMLWMAIGIGSIAYLPALPSPRCCAIVFALALVCVLVAIRLARRHSHARFNSRLPHTSQKAFDSPPNSSATVLGYTLAVHSLALIIGALWGIGYGHFIGRELLPLALEQQSLMVTGRIDGLVEQRAGFGKRPALRWLLRVEHCTRVPAGVGLQAEECDVPLRTVQLTAYDTELRPSGGELWQLRVKLKRPRGFANPGGFDYEAWLVAQRIGATGYVEADSGNRRLAAAPPWSVDRWRSALQQHLAARLRTLAHADLLAGLLIGDGSAIAQDSWNTFRATGTVHLFVVSGLQIAFTGGMALWLGKLWWRSPRSRNRRRDYLLGALPALAIATGYALLAGFGLPLQRALIMFGIVVGTLVLRREIGAGAWVLALWLVLLSNPLAVLDAGFWFSFATVAIILVCLYGARGERSARWSWWRVQSALFITALPLLLVLSGQFTLLALPANALAVPWSTLITMPLAFAALLLDAIAPAWSATLWWLADISLQWLWSFLRWLQQWSDLAIWQPISFGPLSLVCTTVFALLYLLPRGTPGRGWAVVFLLPLGWPQLDVITPGDCRILVIDVGQGLSVLVQTAEHNLLYDTGPLFGPERSVAELAIAPLLRRRGVRILDSVIISHKDSDHAGGWPAIAAQFPVRRLLIGEPLAEIKSELGEISAEHFAAAAPLPEFCRDDEHWLWDGVGFAILHPHDGDFVAGNNRSCVLQIDAGGALILLPGDIERAAEQRLLTRQSLTAPIEILVAPHHGSRSSSTAGFIANTQPRYVVFSTGYRNRFRHPNAEVAERYRQHGAQLFDTAYSGAITFVVKQGHVVQITQQRQTASHYWQ